MASRRLLMRWINFVPFAPDSANAGLHAPFGRWPDVGHNAATSPAACMMADTAARSFFRDLSLPAVVAGFITVLVGFASSAVIVFQAAQALGRIDIQSSHIGIEAR